MRRLFLSDVHLSPLEPARSARFVGFLRREAPRTDELYILGDLFDYWIGPKHLRLADYQEAFDALRTLVQRGVRVVFLHGNRDFYMGPKFQEALGVETHADALDLRGSGGRVHLCHGDGLCLRDRSTRRAQAIIRSKVVEAIFTRLPVGLAKFLAQGYRRHSRRVTALKSRRRLAPAQEAVLGLFAAGVDVIVCGHVHRPAKHTWQIDGREKVLFILGDWSEGASYLVEEGGRWRLYGEPDRSAKKDSGRTGGHSTTA